MKGSIEQKMDVAKYSLELSYNLISHYDSKTNQQLTIAGFDFAIISMLITAMFASQSCKQVTQIVIIVLSVISYGVLSKALWEVKKALMPHVIHHNAGKKPKPGILYFKDIKDHFIEEDYVSMLIKEDKKSPVPSQYYTEEDEEAVAKCFIEDCARDVYAHAVILDEKTRHVHKAFDWVFATTVSCVITVAISSILWIVGC